MYLHISLAHHCMQELYEPLWEDLLRQSDKHGFRIRSIWIADVAWQGTSSNLNAKFLGNDRRDLALSIPKYV